MLTVDYYNSDKLMDIIEGHLRDAGGVKTWDRSWLIPYSSVHADNIIAFLDAINQCYGDVKNYLIDAGWGYLYKTCRYCRISFCKKNQIHIASLL